MGMYGFNHLVKAGGHVPRCVRGYYQMGELGRVAVVNDT